MIAIDQAIQPLLNNLWEMDIETYQSCSGHIGAKDFPSALLWIANSALTDDEIAVLAQKPGIEQVSRLWGRENLPVIEIIFAGETLPLFENACKEIKKALSAFRALRYLDFTVLGNHEDPKGNPIGYTRTTQRQKFADVRAHRYEAWKDYVWACLLKSEPKPPRFENGQKIVVNCYIEYMDRRRPDPGNVVKGIADALADCKRKGILERRLYPNDRNVLERAMSFDYSNNPGVLVVISEA